MKATTQERYLKLVTSTEKQGTRTIYNIGDRFMVEVVHCPGDLENKKSNMNRWKNAGLIPAALPSYLVTHTYYTDTDGNCYGWYNVMEKLSEDGKRLVIDFDYMRAATEENERELVAQCIRMEEMDIRLH